MKSLKKKIINRKFWGKGYDNYLYTGFSGFLLGCNHLIINNFSRKKDFEIIMEFGGAGKPHWHWIDKEKIDNIKEYIIVDENSYLKKLKIPKFLSKKKIIKIDYKDKKKIEKYRSKVDRIIASHVLEHINDPENAIIEWSNLLTKKGSLCVALPCDPGWLFRLAQLVSMKKACKIFRMKPLEKDLWHTREHINSTQRIINIFRYYFKIKKTFWFPLLIPIVNINLFHFIEVNKKDIRF